jgi:predicted ABC-type ATPase
MPHLFLLAGPNGAGKSTSAPQILSGPRGVDEFVNADVIQKEAGVSEIEAGRRTLARLDALAAQRHNIAFETTLSSRGLLPRIRELQAAGYLCHLVFCWLPSADMAVQRVAHRVAAGGHHIPEDVIRRRYERGLENLFGQYLSVVDSWRLLNNTLAPPRLIAWRDVAKSLKILDHRIWTTLSATYMKPRVEQTQGQLTQDDLGWNSEDILQAMNVAVTEALRRHKARGESVVVWRDGKVVVLKPEEIDV